MLVFRRCCLAEIENYMQGRKYYADYQTTGVNTFKYDNFDYIHFYLFPESCISNLYYCSPDTGYIVCDIPKEILEKYYGFGYYPNIVADKYVPIPEFAIPIDLFSLDYIKSIEDCDTLKGYFSYKYEDYLVDMEDVYMIDYKTGKMMSDSSLEMILCKSFVN